MQVEHIEVGLGAKIAGHESPAVTLSHDTHAIRCREAASLAIDRAFAAQVEAFRARRAYDRTHLLSGAMALRASDAQRHDLTFEIPRLAPHARDCLTW